MDVIVQDRVKKKTKTFTQCEKRYTEVGRGDWLMRMGR